MNQNWQRYCSSYLLLDDIGIVLDVSRMKYPADFLTQLKPKCAEALAAMQQLESGAIANPDENRMVGHYWLRSSTLAPSAELATEIENAVSAITDFAQAVHRGEIRSSTGAQFRKLLLIGIGGSALGPQLLQDAFAAPSRPMELHFFDNTDPDGMERTLETLRQSLGETLVLVVSKSGGTTETRNGQVLIQSYFSKHGIAFAQHMVAITVQDSGLDRIAVKEEWLKRFHIWDWVGGRTSIFSAVGLLPAALIGLDIDGFRQGAAAMDAHTRNADIAKNPALLLAAMWHWAGNGTGEKAMVVLPYRDRLVLFSKYLQQLVMESIGKQHNLAGAEVHQGLSVFGNKGSTDQHAYVQQLRDGRKDFFATFIEVLERSYSAVAHPNTPALTSLDYAPIEREFRCGDYLEGFLLGTREALSESGRESILITLEKLNERSVGALIALYERAVGFYATLVGINAYNQPGVEAGKKAATNVLQLQEEAIAALREDRRERSAEELASMLGKPESVETLFKVLCSLAANPYCGVTRRGRLHPSEATFSAI